MSKTKERIRESNLRYKQSLPQRRGAVQIVAINPLVLVKHGSQIHFGVIFIQNRMERLKALDRRLVIGNAHPVKPTHQSFCIHHNMLSKANLIQLNPSRMWFLMKYSGLEGLPFPVAAMPT